jgi:hypothetical protein
MLRTASSLPLAGLLTLGSGPARFQTKPPACYRASWQLPGPDFHRQATTSYEHEDPPWHYVTVSPPVLLGAREDLILPKGWTLGVQAAKLGTDLDGGGMLDVLEDGERLLPGLTRFREIARPYLHGLGKGLYAEIYLLTPADRTPHYQRR